MRKLHIYLSLLLLSATAFALSPVAKKSTLPSDYYNLIPITAVVVIAYVASWLLSRQKKFIDVPTHRKIWNALLVITFFCMAVLAINTVLFIDFNINPLSFVDAIFWHTEFGIAFIIIGVFHAAWHIPYLKQYLPKIQMKKALQAPSAGQQAKPSEPEKIAV